MAYSVDYIKRAVAYKQEGHTLKELREAFGIPCETYYDRKAKHENGCYDIKIKRERKRKIDKEALRQSPEKKPDAFHWELAEQFECTPTAVFHALENMNITRKKSVLPVMKNQMKKEPSLPQG
jgi:transposase